MALDLRSAAQAPRLVSLVARRCTDLAQPSIRRQLFRSIFLTAAAALALVSIPSLLLTAFAVNQHLQQGLEQNVNYLRLRFNRTRLLSHGERERQLRDDLSDLSAGGDLYWIEKPNRQTLLPQQFGRLPSKVVDTRSPLPQSMSEITWSDSVAFINFQSLLSNAKGELFELRRVGPLDYNKDVWVARDFSLLATYLYRYLWLSLAAWLVVLLGSAAVARFLASRLVRPIQLINSHAQTATPERLALLGDRLADAPLELQDLAVAFDGLMVRLASTWSSQNAFTRHVSHELRNPLTLVKGYLERVLRRADGLPAPVQDSIQVAAEETERIIALVGDLMELSRGQMGRLELRDRPTELHALLMRLVQRMQSGLNHPIQLELAADLADPQGACWLELDPDRLEQVLVNLLENAHKYSPAAQPIQLTAAREQGALVLRVIDQGIGVPAADQDLLFEPFVRASNAAAQASGTGLGLPVCRLLVQAMGGSVSLERSALGQGSCFRVQLPFREPAAEGKAGS
jgi:signal transduction histidine kinase